MKIELASADEIAALRAIWQSNPSPWPLKAKRKRRAKGKVRGRKWKGFERVAAAYRKSEKKRMAARPWLNSKKPDAEDKRFERIFKERFEDKNYYAR